MFCCRLQDAVVQERTCVFLTKRRRRQRQQIVKSTDGWRVAVLLREMRVSCMMHGRHLQHRLTVNRIEKYGETAHHNCPRDDPCHRKEVYLEKSVQSLDEKVWACTRAAMVERQVLLVQLRHSVLESCCSWMKWSRLGGPWSCGSRPESRWPFPLTCRRSREQSECNSDGMLHHILRACQYW